jgi:hypothetical protein
MGVSVKVEREKQGRNLAERKQKGMEQVGKEQVQGLEGRE